MTGIYVHQLLGEVRIIQGTDFLPCGCIRLKHRVKRWGVDAHGQWYETTSDWELGPTLSFGECKGPKVIAA